MNRVRRRRRARRPRMEGPVAMTTVRTVIHDRRIEIPAPDALADGMEVILTIGTVVVDENGPMSSKNRPRAPWSPDTARR
jgi:hypothetical protein